MNRILLFIFGLFLSFSLAAQVSPFLSTTWNQTCYYNDSCPVVGSGGSCGRAYTGCNATAMGMICKYYAWPTSGLSSHCNSNLPSQCVTFSAQTYNYAAMPNNVTSANVEVSKLLYHLGAACDMQYSGTSSNSFFDVTVLKRYFSYSPRMYATATFMFPNTQALSDAIKLELDAGRPVYCKGGNHFYLIDGYDAFDNFHVNFGWSGTYNGYYPITNVTCPAGNFTPTNFMFMIRPLAGDLETGNDTIVIPAAGGASNGFEFTSLLNWTISSPTPWITPALTSGTPGYYAFLDGATFAAGVNNGSVRYGYIYVQNANDVDTIVVQQDASPLGSNPDTLYYGESGGAQSAAITYYSWATWSASSPDSWITISPSSGTGNGNPNITATSNPSSTPRLGYVAITGGVFRDTIWVWQDGNTLGVNSVEQELNLRIIPNPANDFITITGLPEHETCFLVIQNTLGEIMVTQYINRETRVDVSGFSPGIYFVSIQVDDKPHLFPVIVAD